MAWRPLPRGRSRVANPGTAAVVFAVTKMSRRACEGLPVHFIFFAAGGGANSCSLETGCLGINEHSQTASTAELDARVINNKTWHKARWLYSATLEAWQAIAQMFANTNFAETSV